VQYEFTKFENYTWALRCWTYNWLISYLIPLRW
jgi:hypothetical protein